ncbi:hypothetical protein TIFTF001_038228 [Ficus carica]|uniref:Uncharacterized protein n=1 Tax=Ficus carica TaxID=3494 RepID=A0AA88EI82_FICCA|nr:hypothetical protein TIFTF001_038223 [Ficus carica]GMN69179.1 hypothetical protein TIFTF001_038228 [Ficus carica]
MDKERGKKPPEEDIEIPASIDLNESNAESDKLMSVFRCSREEFPNEVQLHLPFANERVDTVSQGWICIYTIYFECGLRLPIHPLIIQRELKGPRPLLDVPETKWQVVGEMRNVDRYWQDRYFFMLVNEKSLGKELRKTPSKALLFKAKLERLLTQPNREWDEINIPHRRALRRLFGTSLFIERLSDERVLITDLAFNMMKIDFPFPKEILARKRVE